MTQDISPERIERATEAVARLIYDNGETDAERITRAALAADAPALLAERIAGLREARSSIINAMKFSEDVADNGAYSGGFNDAKTASLRIIDSRIAALEAEMEKVG